MAVFSFTSSIVDHRSYHILSYGTFLGATFFQTFMAGPLAFKALPRPMFARLQQITFPAFFSLQTVLPLAMLLTYPGEQGASVGGQAWRQNAGWSGLMAETNFGNVFVPIMAMLLSSVLNLVALGPLTTKTMKQRHHQETRDGKKSYDAGPKSEEMARLNRRFGILHSISSLSNVIGFGAAVYYGLVLGSRL